MSSFRDDGDVVSRHDERELAVDVWREEAAEAGYESAEIDEAAEDEEPSLRGDPVVRVEQAPV